MIVLNIAIVPDAVSIEKRFNFFYFFYFFLGYKTRDERLLPLIIANIAILPYTLCLCFANTQQGCKFFIF